MGTMVYALLWGNAGFTSQSMDPQGTAFAMQGALLLNPVKRLWQAALGRSCEVLKQ